MKKQSSFISDAKFQRFISVEEVFLASGRKKISANSYWKEIVIKQISKMRATYFIHITISYVSYYLNAMTVKLFLLIILILKPRFESYFGGLVHPNTVQTTYDWHNFPIFLLSVT